MSQVRVRPATAADLGAINAIYNYYVLHSTCTYQTEPETAAAREAWFERHGPVHPVLVAEVDGELVGWGSLSPFHARAAYRHTVENSIYVRHDARRQGIGRVLLEQLVVGAREIGHHAIMALIDADQEASIALHARYGFTQVGRLQQVGLKFGRWLDVVYMELLLS